MSCFRCGKPFEAKVIDGAPDQIELIQLDDGNVHPLCCTKEELVAILMQGSRDNARMMRTMLDLGKYESRF